MPWAMFNPCNPCCRENVGGTYIACNPQIASWAVTLDPDDADYLICTSENPLFFGFMFQHREDGDAKNDCQSHDRKGRYLFKCAINTQPFRVLKSQLWSAGANPYISFASISSTCWVDNELYLQLNYSSGNLPSNIGAVHDWMFPVFKIRMDLNKVTRKWFQDNDTVIGTEYSQTVGVSPFPTVDDEFLDEDGLALMEHVFNIPASTYITNPTLYGRFSNTAHMSWSEYDSVFYTTFWPARGQGRLTDFPDWLAIDKSGQVISSPHSGFPMNGGSVAAFSENVFMKSYGNPGFTETNGFAWVDASSSNIGENNPSIKNFNYKHNGGFYFPLDITDNIVAFGMYGPSGTTPFPLPLINPASELIIGVRKSVFEIGSYNKEQITADDIEFVMSTGFGIGNTGFLGTGIAQTAGFSTQHFDYSS